MSECRREAYLLSIGIRIFWPLPLVPRPLPFFGVETMPIPLSALLVKSSE